MWLIRLKDETLNENTEQANIDDTRKRISEDIQTTSTGKRLRIVNEVSLAAALNEDDDEIEEEIQQIRITTNRSNTQNVQPKVETLEFLEETANIQSTQSRPQNITYMNMDSFTEKTNTVTNQQPAQTRENLIRR